MEHGTRHRLRAPELLVCLVFCISAKFIRQQHLRNGNWHIQIEAFAKAPRGCATRHRWRE